MVALQLGCSPSNETLSEIQKLERTAFEGEVIRPEIRQELMVKYAEFSRLHPDHPFVPEALFRRADLLISAGKFELAVLQLQNLHDGHPTYPQRARCAFLVAFVYEVHLRDLELARRAYERTAALHPRTPEAELAAQSLALLSR
ncbi:MAG: tetratricopeptide repeat protein [Flavobacteriales bacterium]